MATEVPPEVASEAPAGASAELSAPPSHAASVAQLFAAPVVLLSASSDSEDVHQNPAAGFTGAEEDTATRDYAGVEGDEDAEVKRMLADADADGEEDARETSAPSQASSVAKRGCVEGSALVQVDLDALEGTPYCTKCTYPIEDIFRAKLYGKQSGCPTFICRGCNNLISMVAKHMDLNQLASSGLSFASLQGTTTGEEFFKQAMEAANQHGRLAWNQVRELLTSALTERRMQVVTIKYTDKEWPLSVWVTKGFDAEEVKKNGTRVNHPVFSDVYKAPLKETSRANVMHP